MSEFSDLKAEYVRLAGKNPPPMSAEKLAEKVTELQAAAEQAEKAAAETAEAERVAAENAAAEKAAAEKAEAERVASEKAAAEKPKAGRPVEALLGSDILPASIELTPTLSVQLGDVVGHAFEVSGLSVDEFNAQHPSHREEQLQAAIAEMRQAAEQAAEGAAAPSLEEELDALGLTADSHGVVEITMLTGLSGPGICLVNGDPHSCTAAEAVRLVRSGAAQPRG